MLTTADRLDAKVRRWVDANVIDDSTATRILLFEQQNDSQRRSRWPVYAAITFGAIMLAAGILLFVAAHWDELSPTQRFLLVLTKIVALHVAGGLLAPRMKVLGTALHAIGTVALGAGVFLAGQIFNLQEHWPGGVMLWAVGAVLGWVVLRDTAQAGLAALLVPGWITCELGERTYRYAGGAEMTATFVALVAFTYLGARRADDGNLFRRTLGYIGTTLLFPAVLFVSEVRLRPDERDSAARAIATAIALLLPLAAAWFLRRSAAVWNVAWTGWVFVLVVIQGMSERMMREVMTYGWWALGAIGLVWWGIQERRNERINLGVIAFALTVMAFYFSTVVDKLGRSATLISFGLLFLLGGWMLEKLRRRLIQYSKEVTA